MEFKVLGPLEITRNGQKHGPGAPKVRKVLALLALRANQMVTIDSFIDELWERQPPKTAVTTTQTYIYHLRRSFAEATGSMAAERMIETAPPGYILRVEESSVDVWKFNLLISRAQTERAGGRLHEAAGHVEEALGLWNGPPLSNVSCGDLLQSYVSHLEERRIAALELWISVNMQLGNHREMIPELRSLVTRYPFNEWFHQQLMIALRLAGRRNDALKAYQNVRTLLRTELGLEPSSALVRLHQDILSAEPQPAGSPQLIEA